MDQLKEGKVKHTESDPEVDNFIREKLNLPQHDIISGTDQSAFDAKEKLKAHKDKYIQKLHQFERNNSNIVTKYLWLINFIVWNLEGKSNIDFDKMDIPDLKSLLPPK